jgi:enamine deaminase RidA (YjgF/YER057c/UK114 family)
MIKLLNPSDVHAPVGAYSHTAAVPPGTELIFISGQVGIRPDGSVPESFSEQAEYVFQNLRACLAAHGAGMASVAKITTYIVSGHDAQVMREIRSRHFGDHRPASTAVFVPQLVFPLYLLEVEAIAVKPV